MEKPPNQITEARMVKIKVSEVNILSQKPRPNPTWIIVNHRQYKNLKWWGLSAFPGRFGNGKIILGVLKQSVKGNCQ